MKNTKTKFVKPDHSNQEKLYERTDIKIRRTSTGKSFTIVINKSDFDENNDELVLNVNKEFFIKDFIQNEERQTYRFNRIRYV